jgi:signal peptidase I
MTFSQIQQYLGRTIATTTKLLAVIVVLRFFVIDSGIVNGQSMEPTYNDNEFFLINVLFDNYIITDLSCPDP